MEIVKKYTSWTNLFCDVPDCVKKVAYVVKVPLEGMPIYEEEYEHHNICKEHYDYYMKGGNYEKDTNDCRNAVNNGM